MEKLLVIEDNKSLAKLLSKIISGDTNFEVDTAYTMKEAKLFLKRFEYFLVLSDLNLPDAPNGEIVDYLIEKQQKVIVLSGNDDKQFRDNLLQKNIIDYINKDNAQNVRYLVDFINRLQKNQNHKVLIVDDSRVDREVLKKFLKNMFFDVTTVAHGEEAINIINDVGGYSLVVTDYNMPVMNGLELTLEIRKHHKKENLAVIVISGESQSDVIAHLLKAGANDYIKKPYSKEEFTVRVNNTIELLDKIELITNSANRDFLTGLYNRRYFFSHIDELIQKSHEGFDKLYIAMISIDNFKSVNDTYGHETGDKVIVKVADILRSNTNSDDLVSRFGGEEFCIAVLCENHEIAYNIFERIRSSVEKTSIEISSTKVVNFSVSIGVEEFHENIEETINESDIKLYQAKQNGKNQIVF